MGIRVIAYRVGFFILLREIQYSLSQMSHEPLAAAHVPAYQALREEWKLVLLEEISILDDLSQAQAAVDKADRALDVFSGRVSNAVDESTDGKTRKQIRLALLKGKTLGKFRRPVLNGQLLAMVDWSDTLTKCGVPALMALAQEAEVLTAAGKAAEALRTAAQKKNRDFRDVGTRKQFIDKVNATRKETHGMLGKLPFQNPALPQDFAQGFFYSDPPKNDEETIDEVKTSIEELQAQLVARNAQLAKLEEEAANEAKAAQDEAAEEQTVEDLEAQGQALLKKAAALKASRKK
ncbi:MAG: hypothetical protein ACMG6S_29025 [Byssovorax sp.]